MSGGESETADDVDARTHASIEACATTDGSRENSRTEHTQFSHTHRQQWLTGCEAKHKETHE